MLKSKLDTLKKEAQRLAWLRQTTHYVLSTGAIVVANGFLINPEGTTKIEAVLFPSAPRD